MTGDGDRTTAAGWCAPSGIIADLGDADPVLDAIDLPPVSANRGGITFNHPPNPAADALEALRRRLAAAATDARNAAVDAACRTAAEHGWDLHVYDPPTPYNFRYATDRQMAYLRSVGIAFTPAEHPVPTIHHHPCPNWWEPEEDWTP